jgi:hypothetical protein
LIVTCENEVTSLRKNENNGCYRLSVIGNSGISDLGVSHDKYLAEVYAEVNE